MEEISDIVAEKDNERMQSEENGSITVNYYGTKVEYKAQNAEEAQKIKKVMDMLKIQENHKEVGFVDALRKTRIAGLGDKVAEAFDKVVKKEKRDALIGLAASASLYLIARCFDIGPTTETIAYVGSIACGIGNTLVYAKAHLTGVIVNSYLKEDI